MARYTLEYSSVILPAVDANSRQRSHFIGRYRSIDALSSDLTFIYLLFFCTFDVHNGGFEQLSTVCSGPPSPVLDFKSFKNPTGRHPMVASIAADHGCVHG